MALYKRVPTQILIAAYNKKDGADKALAELIEAMKDKQIVCTNVAVAKMDKKGRVRVKELGKPGFLNGLMGGGAHGKAAGAAVGGAALSLLGPIGVTIGGATGGLVGGALGSVQGAVIGSAGKMTVEGMEKDKLDNLGSSLLPETSALVVVFSEVVVSKQKFNEELKTVRGGVDLLIEMMDLDITNKLKEHENVAYHLVVLDGGCVMSQVTEVSCADDFKKVIMSPDDATIQVTEALGDMTTKETGEDVAVAKDDNADADIAIAESVSFETKAVLASVTESHLKKEEVVYTGEGVAGAAATSIVEETLFYMAEDKDCELMA